MSAISAALPAQQRTEPAAPQKTFLDRCVETIDPKVASRLSTHSTLWKVAAVASLVIFTILSMAGFVATNLIAPVYVPIAGISILLLLAPAKAIYQKLISKAESSSEKATQLQKINEKFTSLSKATTQEIQTALAQKGIQWWSIPGMAQNPDELQKLKALIARQDYWTDYCGKLEEKKQVKLKEINEMLPEKMENTTHEKIFNKRLEVLFIEEAQIQTKVNAAFVNAVMRRPSFVGDESNVYYISCLLPEQRIMWRAFADQSGRDYLRFNGDRLPAINMDDIIRMSVSELGERISHAM
ncbi:MAG: hypothetical protein V4492_08455 [Chlamydiota bacterium]